MSCKLARTVCSSRVVAWFALFVTLLLALVALAETKGARSPSGRTPGVPLSLSVGPAVIALQRPLPPENRDVERAPPNRVQRRGPGLDQAGPANPLFVPGSTYSWDGGVPKPLTVVVDVNGDGKADLVIAGTANDNTGTVGVLLGNGDATFQGPSAYDNTGGQAVSPVVVADVNGDGKPDVVVAESCAGWLGNCAEGDTLAGVLLGNGDGTFQPAVVYRTGGYLVAPSIAVADVNGDGKPDLVVADWRCTNTGYQGCVSVLLGNGGGTFQTAHVYDSGGSDSQSIVVADVNGDGKLDLLVSNGGGSPSTVSVLLGQGNGTFQPAVAYSSGGGFALNLVVTDVNGDSKPDLVVANVYSDTIGVLLGNGDGTFRATVLYGSGGQGIVSMVVADVNGDGKPELVVPDWICTNTGYAGCVSVLLGNGDGTFRPAVAYQLGASPLGVAIADLNGDGKPDIAVIESIFNTVSVLLGTGDGSFQPVVDYDSGIYNGNFVDAADLNGDGKPDLLVTGLDANARGAVSVLLNNRAVGYSSTTTTLIASVNPIGLYKTVTYTATVTSLSGGPVTGTITFQDGGTTIGRLPSADNQAAFSQSYNKIASHAITASYSGDGGNNFSSATLTEYVRGTSKMVLTTSGSPSFVGQSVTFTATLTSKYGVIPNGEPVTFYDGKAALASVALAGGTATYTTSSLSAKTHAIKAAYLGDHTFAPSATTVTQVVEKYSTTTSLTSTQNPSHSGQAVTFTANVVSAGPNPPTGKVKFFDGTTSIGSTSLSGGKAKLTKSTLAVGTHPISAQYLGDDASAKSTSVVLNQVVDP